MNIDKLIHDPKIAKMKGLAPASNSFHMSRNTKVGGFQATNNLNYQTEVNQGSSIEEEYISNMQQQVFLLEQENNLLTQKEKERDTLMGLELSDGQPLNEHMVQLKLKQEKCKRELESRIDLQKNTEQENNTSISALTTDNMKLNENCEHLRAKIERTKKKTEEDDLQFRERKDEIENEIERCKKTNKQAFNDLMEAKTEINENLNKKRETERKIEDENKKFRDIEQELLKKIAELNTKIAHAKHERKTLTLDAKEGLSLRQIKAHERQLSNKVQDIKSDAESNHLSVEKSQKQIETHLNSMKDHQTDIAHKKVLIDDLDEKIKGLADDKGQEKMKEMLESHSERQVFKLEIETEQEKDRSNNFQENIKGIEQDSNKQRNLQIKECNEKDELKSGQSKLDEQQKKQAGEIATLKHTCLENEKKLEHLNDTEQKEEKEQKALNKSVHEGNIRLSDTLQAINMLKEKSQNFERFKHIDMTEITSIVDHNKNMSNFLDNFLNRFTKMSEE